MKSDNLYQMFLDATCQICQDLEMDPNKVETGRDETKRKGLDYSATGENGNTRFYFHVRTDTDKDDVTTGKMQATVEIGYDEGSNPFFLSEDITGLRNHSDFLARWTAWAVHNFNLEHNPVNLKSFFNEMDIRVYGIPRQPHPTMTEMHLLMSGAGSLEDGRILIYKFRHVELTVKYRWFSYGFFIESDDCRGCWVFFLKVGGLDSGGAKHTLDTTEKLIEKIKIKTQRKYFDIEHDKLERFLSKNAIGFITRRDGDVLFSLNKYHGETFGEYFTKSYSAFLQRYENEEYPQALRDLRALVQEAMEFVCKAKNIDIAGIKPPNIGKICAILVKNNVIDGRITGWFDAFTSVANTASHKEFPSERDLRDFRMEERIKITVLMGAHLIDELGKTIDGDESSY